MPRCAPAASDNPLGVCLERGIITYLPLIAASMAIQPSVLPAARLSAALPLETGGGESRSDALSLDDRPVRLKAEAARPPGAFDEWADLFSQLDGPHEHTHPHTHGVTPGVDCSPRDLQLCTDPQCQVLHTDLR